MNSPIPTRFLILSDTHGKIIDLPKEPVDVLIHCGDLTEESKLLEFKITIQMLHQVEAPLKLVIPGNHDFTLDDPMFLKKLAEARLSPTDSTVIREYGEPGSSRKLFDESQDITFLDEGTHHFSLANGAALTVYASPYTPSTNDWGFQYDPQGDHIWDIGMDVNVVITHGPPHGIFDQGSGNLRAGSPSLFKAIANSRPQLHCFGHMHAGWGGKVVSWRDESNGEVSHFTAIDNEESEVVESLAKLRAGRFDSEERRREKEGRLEELTKRGYCAAVGSLGKTVFVNAAIEECHEEDIQHMPWIVGIALPRAQIEQENAEPSGNGKEGN